MASTDGLGNGCRPPTRSVPSIRNCTRPFIVKFPRDWQERKLPSSSL